MPAQTLSQWKQLLDTLYSGPARRLLPARRAFSAQARACGFPEALETFPPQGRAHCGALLRLCQPLLDRLCPEPEGGWLPFLYDSLADGLFRDPLRPADTPAQAQAKTVYLAVLERYLAAELSLPHDPLTDVPPLTGAELGATRIGEEYDRFLQAVAGGHFIALMRIGREIKPFDPASHTIGVHHIALTAARQAAQAGLPVDVALVSAAALSHDIGKFGCRGKDASRIPYLHYYYTFQWLSEHGCPAIAHVAANHSTWDLEFENLPLESLLLIYADFRVRGVRERGREVVRIHSLDESYDMILSKLDNMTDEKRRRYQTVYAKLHDFECFLRARGVNPDNPSFEPPPARPDAALLTGPESVAALCDLTFSNNVALMHTVTVDASFEQLLEASRSERDLNRIRTYLRLFSEYHTYMTGANKRLVLAFLYELLMHHQGDVRRRAGHLMGEILANSGPRYRKELPESAPREAMAPTLLSFLSESVELWNGYLESCLHPDHKITAKHATRISNSLKIIAGGLFESCTGEEAPHYLAPLFQAFLEARGGDRFVLTDTMLHVPLPLLTREQAAQCLERAGAMLCEPDTPLRLASLFLIERLLPRAGQETAALVPDWLAPLEGCGEPSVAYLAGRLRRAAGLPPSGGKEADKIPASQLYLANLKNAVHWGVKLIHIDMLCDDVLRRPEHAFHTATHLSNLLSVSEHLPVRERAGEGLLRIADHLAMDQLNEITVDLLRELETGQEEISRYIPRYLGPLLCRLPEKEFDEGLAFLEDFARGASVTPARAALRTLGVILRGLLREGRAGDRLVARVLGLLLTGVAHFNAAIHQTALGVLCRDVLGDETLPLETRRGCFLRVGKKLLTLLDEPRAGQLTFFTQASLLNCLYRFLVRCQVELGPFPYGAPRPAAFFPGTFDPFSLGHKRIVEEIRALGFDVYLAIDEFSWSKRTLAKLQRRQIASMSTADQLDVYLFPDDVPVNIAMPDDLKKLAALFPGRELYLVAGSDVIRNASAYRDLSPGSAADYNHVIFCRDQAEDPSLPPIASIIRGKLKLLSLPAYYETVSSTRIREYVDKNMDISMLVDPIVQSYIYGNSFYLRAPQFKNVLTPQELRYEWREGIPDELAGQTISLRARLPEGAELYTVLLRSRGSGKLHGWAVGHTVRAAGLYDALGDLELADYVRRHTSGRILMVDAARDTGKNPDTCRALVGELLARSLLSDHTYALYRRAGTADPLWPLLPELGFRPAPDEPGVLAVDMRTPLAFIQDVYLRIKEPHSGDSAVRAAVAATRPKMRRALARLFPGRLVLSFDAEMLNQALLTKVQSCNGVLNEPAGQRRLGPYMCVPYGKILSGEIVPNTVTKTLHADKVYHEDMSRFSILEHPGYSTLQNQARTIKSFRRPVLLVDDILHKGYRIEKLDPIFREEDVAIDRIIVGILSGRGRDLMQRQGRRVECEYFIPNLSYWFTESLLYPFLGGDSTEGQRRDEGLLASVNLILPYEYPEYLKGAAERDVRRLSLTALENARAILRALERCHQAAFSTALTVRRLAEALYVPRIPDKGPHMQYNRTVTPSVCVDDDIAELRRICQSGDFEPSGEECP